MKRPSTLRDAAADATHLAAERGQAALDQAIERLTPLVDQATDLLEQAGDRVGPLAKAYRAKGAAALDTAVERLTPLVEQAADTLAEASARLGEATEKVGPLAHDYRVKGAAFAARALEDAQPRINSALGKVTPAVDAAQKRVQDDLIPKLVALLNEAADSPLLAEAAARSASAVDSVSGHADMRPRKRRVGRTIAKVAAAGALVAGVAVAVRTFLNTRDTGWAAHEPSPAYTYADEPAAPQEEVVDVFVDEEGEDAADASSPVDSDGATGEGLADEVAGEATDVTASYGEDSYVGTEPPEGYVIKGSARSKKYHTPESGAYERTTADVWFNSEEAAANAGFTRAQR